MDLTFQAPLARHADSARPPMRSFSTSARCFNCGQTGHLRSTCRSPRRSPPVLPFGVGFQQRTSRSPRSNADAFRAVGANPQCFVCGSSAHLARNCPARSASSGHPPPGRVQTMQQLPVDRSQVRFPTCGYHPHEGCIFTIQDEVSLQSTKLVVSPGAFRDPATLVELWAGPRRRNPGNIQWDSTSWRGLKKWMTCGLRVCLRTFGPLSRSPVGSGWRQWLSQTN